MNQTIFIADGKTKVFHFTFPFFLKSDVIIEVDSEPATNYNLICVKNGLNANIPFCGGSVHFTKPPKLASVINIRRVLPLTRIVDYQPTAPYNPTALNQDLNYLMEVIKDLKSVVDFLQTLPTDAANKAAIDAISGQIAQIVSSIDAINTRIEQIAASDATQELSEVHDKIKSIKAAIDTLNTQYGELKTQIENIGTTSLPEGMDYVIESQHPTAENNYTWYRKYKSGWVEQGGKISNKPNEHIILPKSMQDTQYSILLSFSTESGNTPQYASFAFKQQQTTGFIVCNYGSIVGYWVVHGFASN